MLKLLVRPVTMADKPAVLRISSRIWQGNDYVPLFFDRWVKEGGFWAAELRGRLVGYGKATQLSPGEWWLEGLRVDPRYRKRGIGKEISRQALQRTLEERPISLRLSTADVNQESIHIIETGMGFRPCAQFRFFVGKPAKRGLSLRGALRDSRGPSPFRPWTRPLPRAPLVRPSFAEALDYVRRSPELSASRGLLQYTWLFRSLDRRYMIELIRGGHVSGYCVAGKLAGVIVLGPHRYHGNDLDISFIAGDRKALAAFGSFIARVAHDCGSKNISGMAASDEMAAAFASLGLKPHPRIGSVLVYEYPI